MARNDMPIDKEESSGGFERILLFLIPIIFTIVLVAVLLTLFNVNVRNGMMDVANKIPIVKNWVPDPKLTPEEEKEKKLKDQEVSAEATIQELKKAALRTGTIPERDDGTKKRLKKIKPNSFKPKLTICRTNRRKPRNRKKIRI
nr:hypothetical protein [Paenibacillus sp. DMB20]